jgi:hypothetical protein
MSASEKEVWREVMASTPSGLIKPAAYTLMEIYCHHVALARTLNKALKRCKPGSSQSVTIARMLRGETGAMVLMARQLRLTPRSQTNSRAASRQMERAFTEDTAEKPWEA